MRRRFLPCVLVLSVGAIAAPASHASASMCLVRDRCTIPVAHAYPAHVSSEVAARPNGPVITVVPVRSDGSQHGGVPSARRAPR